MFIKWNDPAVRLTGRWSRLAQDSADVHAYVKPTAAYAACTAAGSYFELAFEGRYALLHFDLGYQAQPVPHLWIQVDGGARVEAPLDRHLRIDAMSEGSHIVKVIYKGGMEQLHRWYLPLNGAVAFIGADAAAPGVLPKDERRIIEFIGDSITEGVLIDTDYTELPENQIDQFNRPYQDDNCATYASLTAEKLNLRPIFQAYGAIGLTRSGCGAVPRAGAIYPYVFDGAPYTGEKPDVIVINHGTNDRNTTAQEYISRYEEFIEQAQEINPGALIVCLGAFCGAYDEELREMQARWNARHERRIYYVPSAGWVPLEPLHPTREGHRIIAEHFAPLLKAILDENRK